MVLYETNMMGKMASLRAHCPITQWKTTEYRSKSLTRWKFFLTNLLDPQSQSSSNTMKKEENWGSTNRHRWKWGR